MILLLLGLAFQTDDLDALRARFEAEKGHPSARRLATVSALGELKSDQAAEVLVEILEQETDPAVKARALDALAACGSEPAEKKLAALARDAKEPILHRTAALRGLMEGKRPAGLEAARAALREGGEMRAAAGLSLHHYPLAETEPAWRGLLNDPDPLLRGRALQMLAPLRDFRLIDTARQALANPAEFPFVKYGAVAVCRDFGGPAMSKALLGAANSPDPTLRRLLSQALGTFSDDETVKAVYAALRHPEAPVRAVAARSLGTLKHAQAMDRLAEPLRDKSPEVHLAALEAVADRRDKSSETILLREAQRTDEEAAAAAIALLPAYPSENTKALLLKLAASYKPATALPALEALGDLGAPEALGAYEKALKHKEWPVRSAAIRGLARLRTKEAVDLLVDRMAEEKGRLLWECGEALQKLTGKAIGFGAGAWKEWWTAQRDAFAFPDKAGAPEAAAAGMTTYHGIPVLSTRIVFCLDISGSMSEKTGAETRLDQAKKELSRVLGQLDKEAHVNLIFFDDKVYPWQQSLVPIRSNLQRANQIVGGQQPRGTTNIFDTLAAALQHKEVDTIYLLSDGEPTAGRVVEIEDVLREVRRINRLRQVIIHTISFGPSPFMKRLADQNGGQYAEIR